MLSIKLLFKLLSAHSNVSVSTNEVFENKLHHRKWKYYFKSWTLILSISFSLHWSIITYFFDRLLFWRRDDYIQLILMDKGETIIMNLWFDNNYLCILLLNISVHLFFLKTNEKSHKCQMTTGLISTMTMVSLHCLFNLIFHKLLTNDNSFGLFLFRLKINGTFRKVLSIPWMLLTGTTVSWHLLQFDI